MNPTSLIQFFSLKPWKIQRKIFDQLLNSESFFVGTAYIFPDKSKWIYEERGQLVNKSHTYNASRRYIYDIQNNTFLVRFDDGRLFYEIDCAQLPKARYTHFCAPDKYEGKIILQQESWRNEWIIRGPNKNQIITSNYF